MMGDGNARQSLDASRASLPSLRQLPVTVPACREPAVSITAVECRQVPSLPTVKPSLPWLCQDCNGVVVNGALWLTDGSGRAGLSWR